MTNNSVIYDETMSSPKSSGENYPMTHNVQLRSVGVCAECGQKIAKMSDGCQAMGCNYHNSCFVCCCCRRSLRGKIFYKDGPKIFCEEDYLYCGFQHTTEKCNSCGHIIAELILQAMGRSYHPGCFRCAVCSECLDGVPFAIGKNNQIYCLYDYYLIHAPRCAKCSEFILPQENSDEIKRVISMDKDFHVECYKCEDCNISLQGKGEIACYPMRFKGSDGKETIILLCLNCHLNKLNNGIGGAYGTSDSPKLIRN